MAYHERLTKSSGSIHNVMRFRAEVEHDPAAAEAMAYKAAVVNEALAALRQGQRDRLGPIMDRDFDLRQSVCGPAPEQTRMIAIAREQGAHAKFTGSGSAAIQGCGGADARRACSRRGTFGLRGAVEVGFVAGVAWTGVSAAVTRTGTTVNPSAAYVRSIRHRCAASSI